jgi:hypothetical protein
VSKTGKFMVHEEKNSGFRIVIPISGMEELAKYQQGLVAILNKVEVGNCDPILKENLKYVFELLSYLGLDKKSFIQQRELRRRTRQRKLKRSSSNHI